MEEENMKILKNNFATETVTCKHCSSILEISQDDIKEWGGKDKIICPCCLRPLIGTNEKHQSMQVTQPSFEEVDLTLETEFEEELKSVPTGVTPSREERIYIWNPDNFFIPPERYFLETDEVHFGLQELCKTSCTSRDFMDLWKFYEQFVELLKVNGHSTIPSLEDTRHILEQIGYSHDVYFDGYWGIRLRNNVINPDGTVSHPHRVHGDHAPHPVRGYYRKNGTWVEPYQTGVVK